MQAQPAVHPGAASVGASAGNAMRPCRACQHRSDSWHACRPWRRETPTLRTPGRTLCATIHAFGSSSQRRFSWPRRAARRSLALAFAMQSPPLWPGSVWLARLAPLPRLSADARRPPAGPWIADAPQLRTMARDQSEAARFALTDATWIRAHQHGSRRSHRGELAMRRLCRGPEAAPRPEGDQLGARLSAPTGWPTSPPRQTRPRLADPTCMGATPKSAAGAADVRADFQPRRAHPVSAWTVRRPTRPPAPRSCIMRVTGAPRRFRRVAPRGGMAAAWRPEARAFAASQRMGPSGAMRSAQSADRVLALRARQIDERRTGLWERTGLRESVAGRRFHEAQRMKHRYWRNRAEWCFKTWPRRAPGAQRGCLSAARRVPYH
jgi:hypothetical protein